MHRELHVNMVSYRIPFNHSPLELTSKGLHLELLMEINRSDAGIKQLQARITPYVRKKHLFLPKFLEQKVVILLYELKNYYGNLNSKLKKS